MNSNSIKSLKLARKLYSILNSKKTVKNNCINDVNVVSDILYQALMEEKPCMIARFGATELLALVNYIGVKHQDKDVYKYIQGNIAPWWWEKGVLQQMYTLSGFFPLDMKLLEKFCEMTLQDISSLDVLGSWLDNEIFLDKELEPIKKVRLLFLEPFWADEPWTRALEGKNVLVLHPFAETISRQYEKRHLLFNKSILPDFNLTTIKAVQSIAGNKTPFSNWFEALDFMKAQMDKVDYDICLIGAGAYGFPLSAHVKRMGKKAIHMGGSLQLLFGIWGKRWDNIDYGVQSLGKKGAYLELKNEHWVKPDISEKPANSEKVENSCYW